jgi:transposase
MRPGWSEGSKVPEPKMNDVDPQAWLADVLARLPDHPANKVADLLPWNWKANLEPKAAVAA